jgi:hypothetical protein
MAIDVAASNQSTARSPRTVESGATRSTYRPDHHLGALLRPFLWTISTSLKTLPETTGFDLLPTTPACGRIASLGQFDFCATRPTTSFSPG